MCKCVWVFVGCGCCSCCYFFFLVYSLFKIVKKCIFVDQLKMMKEKLDADETVEKYVSERKDGRRREERVWGGWLGEWVGGCWGCGWRLLVGGGNEDRKKGAELNSIEKNSLLEKVLQIWREFKSFFTNLAIRLNWKKLANMVDIVWVKISIFCSNCCH